VKSTGSYSFLNEDDFSKMVLRDEHISIPLSSCHHDL